MRRTARTPHNNSLDRSRRLRALIKQVRNYDGLAVRRQPGQLRRSTANLMTHSVLSVALLLLFAAPIAAQSSFYFDEGFKHLIRVPDGLVPLLRAEVKSHCPHDPELQATDIRKLFSASRISLNRPALILKSGGHCLTGADNDWFWVYLKTHAGYRKVLTGGTITLDVLKRRTHGLRDIETNACTAAYCFRNVYKFNGSLYHVRICSEAQNGNGRPKYHRVPCRQ